MAHVIHLDNPHRVRHGGAMSPTDKLQALHEAGHRLRLDSPKFSRAGWGLTLWPSTGGRPRWWEAETLAELAHAAHGYLEDPSAGQEIPG